MERKFTTLLIFILVLFLSSISLLYLNINGYIDLQNSITLFAVIIALITSITSLLLNYRTLEQSEKNLKIELAYEDRKKALIKLYELFDFPEENIKDIEEMEKVFKEISSFVNDPIAVFLPNNTFNLLENLVEEALENKNKNQEKIEKLKEKLTRLETKKESINSLENLNEIKGEFKKVEGELNNLEEEIDNSFLSMIHNLRSYIKSNIKRNLREFQKDLDE